VSSTQSTSTQFKDLQFSPCNVCSLLQLSTTSKLSHSVFHLRRTWSLTLLLVMITKDLLILASRSRSFPSQQTCAAS
jgi:hypothetical protein